MNLYHESIKYSLIQETSDICKVLLGSSTSSVWRISVTLGITFSENYLSKEKKGFYHRMRVMFCVTLFSFN